MSDFNKVYYNYYLTTKDLRSSHALKHCNAQCAAIYYNYWGAPDVEIINKSFNYIAQ